MKLLFIGKYSIRCLVFKILKVRQNISDTNIRIYDILFKGILKER